ncbi:MAG: hypothetical protein ACYSW4_01480 [Planctomycetota bacterium]
MTKSETAQKNRWKPKTYHVLLVLLLIAIGCFIFFRVSLKSKLQKKLDAIRAAGYPVTGAELDDWYAIPADAENAAHCLIDAFSHYQEWFGEKRELLPIIGPAQLPPRTEPLAEETKTIIAECLADNQQALALLHEGAAIKHCRYPVDFSRGLAALVPYLSEIRTGARLLQLEAILHGENAQPELAVRSTTSIFGLARSLSNEPLLISQLVRIACQALGVSCLERVLNRTELTDGQLVHLSQTVTNAQDLSGLSCAFAGERCQGIEFFREPTPRNIQLIGDPAPPAPLMVLYRATGLSDKDALIYLDLMEAYIKANQLPPHQRREAADAVEDTIENISKIHILLRTFMPALSRVTELDIRAIAHLRTAQVAIAIQRYRLAAGKLPDNLSDLAPAYLDALPKDPFDGQDIRYRKLETGFVVYSIGEDERDDGGKERRRKSRDKNYDITFIIER